MRKYFLLGIPKKRIKEIMHFLLFKSAIPPPFVKELQHMK